MHYTIKFQVFEVKDGKREDGSPAVTRFGFRTLADGWHYLLEGQMDPPYDVSLPHADHLAAKLAALAYWFASHA